MWGQIEYKRNAGVVILDCGYCFGREYVIAFVRVAPCVYMIANGSNRSLIDAPCHGGITYQNITLPDWRNDNILPDPGNVDHCNIVQKVGKWIGWDYTHDGDYMAGSQDGHKYTIEEIRQDVYRTAQYLGIVR